MLGLGGAMLLARDTKAPVEVSEDLSVPVSSLARIDTAARPAIAEGVAGDAAAAVRGYLDAELAGDTDASYGFLSTADRAILGSAQGWALAHADLFPLTGYVLADTLAVEGGVDVMVAVTYEPSLDEVVGLVPARADATFRAVAEEHGWRVDLADSFLEPRYPDEADARDAVAAWAVSRQACEEPAEYTGGLVGTPALAEALCGADGALAVGMAQALHGDPAATPVLAAFGEDATAWARAVDVAGPVEFRAVVAPVGDEWVVVGILPAQPGGDS